ncbi:MAG: hypothetical protein MJZ30_07375 [Paludibacteraceae bacterium]|nr:hypothetical protein [Paludibacteraceae bacterium]
MLLCMMFRMMGYVMMWHKPAYRAYRLHSLSKRENGLELFIQFLLCLNFTLISQVWRIVFFFAGFHAMWFWFVLMDCIAMKFLNKK